MHTFSRQVHLWARSLGWHTETQCWPWTWAWACCSPQKRALDVGGWPAPAQSHAAAPRGPPPVQHTSTHVCACEGGVLFRVPARAPAPSTHPIGRAPSPALAPPARAHTHKHTHTHTQMHAHAGTRLRALVHPWPYPLDRGPQSARTWCARPGLRRWLMCQYLYAMVMVLVHACAMLMLMRVCVTLVPVPVLAQHQARSLTQQARATAAADFFLLFFAKAAAACRAAAGRWSRQHAPVLGLCDSGHSGAPACSWTRPPWRGGSHTARAGRCPGRALGPRAAAPACVRWGGCYERLRGNATRRESPQIRVLAEQA